MKKILAVDLDETLIHSDILFETFWSAFSFDWKIPIKSVGWLLKGKGQLKHNLVHSSDINVKNLPYNKDVINYIKQHRKRGGYTVLVTASNQTIAEKIAKNYPSIVLEKIYFFDFLKNGENKVVEPI